MTIHPDLSAAWHRLDSEAPAPVKLPDERAITDLHTPVVVEFLGERKRLTYAADARLPKDCVHTLACAAELADLVEPVSGVRAAATSDAQTLESTRDLGPLKSAAVGETAAAVRRAAPVPGQPNESAAARSAGAASTLSELRVVEAGDVARATAVSGQSGERLVAGSGGLARGGVR